jgi:hypothetical protein
MHKAIIKSIFLLIIFSNHIFTKDLDNLFNITMRVNDESIDKNIDRSFNHLVFRLLGYQDLQKAKMLKGNYDSKDFIYNYSVINIDGSKFLQASFDEEIVINQFIQNELSFIGRNRPVIFLDIQIDNGFNEPFKIESIPYETKLESSLQRIFDNISEERGLFFEFPQNTINIKKNAYFFEDENSDEFKEYKFDYLDSLFISRSGINNWSLTYKDKTSLFESIDEMIISIRLLFDRLATSYLSDFILEATERSMVLKVNKVKSVDNVDSLLDALDEMISIKEYSITAFKKDQISIALKIFGTEEQFIKSVQNHKDFILELSTNDLIEASLNSL